MLDAFITGGLMALIGVIIWWFRQDLESEGALKFRAIVSGMAALFCSFGGLSSCAFAISESPVMLLVGLVFVPLIIFFVMRCVKDWDKSKSCKQKEETEKKDEEGE